MKYNFKKSVTKRFSAGHIAVPVSILFRQMSTFSIFRSIEKDFNENKRKRELVVPKVSFIERSVMQGHARQVLL